MRVAADLQDIRIFLIQHCCQQRTPNRRLKGTVLRDLSVKIRLISLVLSVLQRCFLCHLSDSTVSEDAGIEPRTVATLAFLVGRFNHSARSYKL
jgi:hypothetical protein